MRMSINNRLRVESLEAREVPAGDLAAALQLTGLSATANVRVASDLANNTIVAGTFTGTLDLDPSLTGSANVLSNGGTDIFVAKYGADGKLVWARSLGGAGADSLADLAFDPAGNVYIGGTFNGAVDFNPNPNVTATATSADGGSGFVWKLNFFGDLVWGRTIDGPSSISALAIDPQGSVVTTGIFHGTTDFDPTDAGTANLTTTNVNGAAFAWRLDPNGGLQWAKGFQTTGSIEAPAVTIDGSGNTYVAGRLTGTADLDPADATKAQMAAGSTWLPYVVKLNTLGNYVWAKGVRTAVAATAAPNSITGIGVDSIGNVYTAGTFAGTLDFDPSTTGTTTVASTGNGVDGFVWKLGSDGSFRWARGFGGVSPETITDLFVDKAGNTYTTGTFHGVADFDPNPLSTVNLVSGSGDTDGFVEKLGPGGGLLYARVLGGGVSTTKPTGIWANGAGSMVVTGTFVGTADLDPSTTLVPVDGGTGSGFVVRLTPAAGATPGPANSPPMNVTAGGSYTIKEGQGLTVTASAVDPDKDKLTYTWDLNGDGKFGDAVGSTASLTAAQMAALGLQDGTSVALPIRVRVRDGVNMAAEAVATLTIKDLPPTATLTAPTKIAQSTRPTITVTPTGDPSTADTKAGFKYSYDFNDDGQWDLGDGATYAGSVTTNSLKVPSDFVPNSGPISVRVRVFDKDGGYVDKTAVIEVINAPPTATFSVSGTPAVGNPMTFSFANPQDTPNDVAAGFTYAFDFDGDGNYEVTSKSPTVQHTFSYLGVFTVHAAVIDQDGGFTVYTATVNVTQ
jgi:hypothetical protein